MTPDPKLDFRDWIRPRFDDTAISVTFSASDDLDIANYDVGPAWPSIAIVDATPVVRGGGATGATSFDPTGAGAYQEVDYLITVDCWGGPRTADIYASEGSDPDTVAVELAMELHRAARGEEATPSGYEYAFADPPQDATTTNEDETEYRQQVTARLGYRFGPA